MIKACDLVKKQSKIEKHKIDAYKNLYIYIQKKIETCSISNNYYTWYALPECLIGYPMYNLEECEKYVTQVLKENGFSVDFYDPNILFISWFPENTKKKKVLSVYKPDVNL